MMKSCSTCTIPKDLEEFHRNRKAKDGRHSVCKVCAKNYQVKYRKTAHGREVKKRSTRNGGRFYCAKRHAVKHGREWALTKEQYNSLVQNPCTYCGGNLPEAGVGLDRQDSSVGYTFENVTPCCTQCNTVKSNFFSYEEMQVVMRWVKRRRAR